MSLLLALAPELMSIIIEELDMKDIKGLRLTCKQLSGLLAARVFRLFSINLDKNKIQEDISKLRTLATEACAVSSETVELNIASLSPGRDPQYGFAAGEQWIGVTEPKDSLEVTVAEEDMKVYLYDALSSLKSVRTVRWDPCVKDKAWIFNTVLDALRTLPNLRSLHININHCNAELRLDKLIGLQEISLRGTKTQYYGQIMEHFSRMIANSPQLTSIVIASYYKHPSLLSTTKSLHHLFQYYPQDAKPLRLRSLSLETYCIPFDQITMPHLKYLTSLTLKNIFDTSGGSSLHLAQGTQNSESNPNEEERFGSTQNEIWSMLAQAAIQLEEICVDQVVSNFLKYLESYSGLRKLKLRIGRLGRHSDQIASHFYESALNNHLTSLEKLDIVPRYEGLWCFGAHNQTLISKCTKIKELHMCVISPQIMSEADTQEPSTTDVIKLFIDTVAICIPRIENFTISASRQQETRKGGNIRLAANYMVSAKSKILESVRRYRAPPSCRQLPNLIIASFNTFVGQLDEQGEFKYRETRPLDAPY
ncbi:hypothetical protein B0H34DRAFT_114298 [Crassisporium funariophilum]|nr:hypothetical protein B0H34DRAFT_114298 [Crassisporium funariophilum]